MTGVWTSLKRAWDQLVENWTLLARACWQLHNAGLQQLCEHVILCRGRNARPRFGIAHHALLVSNYNNFTGLHQILWRLCHNYWLCVRMSSTCMQVWVIQQMRESHMQCVRVETSGCVVGKHMFLLWCPHCKMTANYCSEEYLQEVNVKGATVFVLSFLACPVVFVAWIYSAWHNPNRARWTESSLFYTADRLPFLCAHCCHGLQFCFYIPTNNTWPWQKCLYCVLVHIYGLFQHLAGNQHALDQHNK